MVSMKDIVENVFEIGSEVKMITTTHTAVKHEYLIKQLKLSKRLGNIMQNDVFMKA